MQRSSSIIPGLFPILFKLPGTFSLVLTFPEYLQSCLSLRFVAICLSWIPVLLNTLRLCVLFHSSLFLQHLCLTQCITLTWIFAILSYPKLCLVSSGFYFILFFQAKISRHVSVWTYLSSLIGTFILSKEWLVQIQHSCEVSQIFIRRHDWLPRASWAFLPPC